MRVKIIKIKCSDSIGCGNSNGTQAITNSPIKVDPKDLKELKDD
jgi:hypothetical protein